MGDASPLLARFSDFEIDEANARLMRGGRPVELPPKAFAVLCELARRPGRLVTKDALLDAVWGHRHTSDSVLKTIVSQLRGVLADDAREPRFIETASRRGYRFIAPLDGPSIRTALPEAAVARPVAPPAPPADWVGRAGDLRTLLEAFEAAASARRQVVFVAGEAGIGKSSLIDRFVAAVAPRRPALGIGQCVEHYGAAEPYMPVLEALSMLCREDADVLAQLRQVAPSWLAQLPWYHSDEDRQRLAREVPGGATQDRMLREFGELADRWAAARPLLIVLEDLHWSDPATVQWIAYLARRRTPAALLVVASLRLAEVVAGRHPLADLRLDLRAHRLCHEIDVEPLSESEVGTWLARRLERPEAPEPLVRALHAHTGGVPLFLAAMVEEQIDAGRLRPGVAPAPDAAASLAVPSSIVGVIERQLARLDATTLRLLEAAAMVGVDFDHLTVAGVLDEHPDTVRATLDAAAATRHWIRVGTVEKLPYGRLAARYQFRHALHRRVLYDRLCAADRMQRHRGVAEALVATRGESTGELAAELAMHYERGGEPVQAAFQWAAVASRALSRGAAHEAMQAARHGQGLIDSRAAEPTPAAALLELVVLEAVALTRTQVISAPDVAEAFERACSIARSQRGGAARARAMHGRWWVHYARGELDDAGRLAQAMLDRALADGDAALERAARSALGNTHAMMGRFVSARAELESVVASAPGQTGVFVQDLGVEARAQLALVLWWQGEPLAARRCAAEAVELAEAVGHPVSQLVALNMAAAMHHHAGEFEAALPLNERIFEVIRHHGLPTGLGSFLWLHGRLLARLGRVDEGLAELQTAGASCETLGMRIGLSAFHLHLAEVYRDLGRVDDAEAAVQQGLALAQATREAFVVSLLHRVQAELRLARGDVEGFEAALRRAAGAAQEHHAPFQALVALVTAGQRPGGLRDEEADQLAALLAAYRDESSPWVLRARALLR